MFLYSDKEQLSVYVCEDISIIIFELTDPCFIGEDLSLNAKYRYHVPTGSINISYSNPFEEYVEEYMAYMYNDLQSPKYISLIKEIKDIYNKQDETYISPEIKLIEKIYKYFTP